MAIENRSKKVKSTQSLTWAVFPVCLLNSNPSETSDHIPTQLSLFSKYFHVIHEGGLTGRPKDQEGHLKSASQDGFVSLPSCSRSSRALAMQGLHGVTTTDDGLQSLSICFRSLPLTLQSCWRETVAPLHTLNAVSSSLLSHSSSGLKLLHKVLIAQLPIWKHSLILCPLPLATFCSKSPCSILLGSLKYTVPEHLTFQNLVGFTFGSLGIQDSGCTKKGSECAH